MALGWLIFPTEVLGIRKGFLVCKSSKRENVPVPLRHAVNSGLLFKGLTIHYRFELSSPAGSFAIRLSANALSLIRINFENMLCSALTTAM